MMTVIHIFSYETGLGGVTIASLRRRWHCVPSSACRQHASTVSDAVRDASGAPSMHSSAMFFLAWQNHDSTSAYSSDHFHAFCVCDPMIVTNPASPKLKFSETSNAKMMSADVSVECVREPFWTGTCCKHVERPSAEPDCWRNV